MSINLHLSILLQCYLTLTPSLKVGYQYGHAYDQVVRVRNIYN
jgi:hypothetical protein